MKKLLVAIAILFSTNAFAGILVEPYVGYMLSGSYEQESTSTDADVTGLGYGARLGYTVPMFFFAADFGMGALTVDANGVEFDVTPTNMGLVVGANLPMIRLWAGYIFSAKADVEDTSGGADDEIEGTGMKAGLGYKLPVLPLSLNLEYAMYTYDEANGIALTGANELEVSGIVFSVSAPLNF